MVGLARHNRRYTLQSRPTVRIRLRNNHIQSTSSLRKVLRTGAEPPPFRSAVWVNLLGLSSAQTKPPRSAATHTAQEEEDLGAGELWHRF